jgi:hypothetical protein
MNVLFTQELGRKISSNKTIKTVCLHPGAVDTNFGSDVFIFKCLKVFLCCIFVSNTEGAKTSIYLSTEDFSKLRNGEYYDSNT